MTRVNKGVQHHFPHPITSTPYLSTLSLHRCHDSGNYAQRAGGINHEGAVATLLDRSPGCQLVDRHRLASHYVWSLLQVFQRRLWTLPVQGQVTTQVATRPPTGLTSGVNAQGVSVHQTSSSSSFQAPALITDKSLQRWHRAHHMLLELASKAGSLSSACFAQDTWQCRAHLKRLTKAESYLLCGLHMQSCLVHKHAAAYRCRYAAQ